jgi:ribosomal peptide maturation radical SAM protein 1
MTAPAAAAPEVCFVTMPYASLARPSMGLGILKAVLAEAGIGCAVANANLWFAEQVGLKLYELCASRIPTDLMIGEWTFAQAAFGARAELDEEFLTLVCEGGRVRSAWSDGLVDQLRALRVGAVEFVDAAARRVLATGARIVGCTSVFEQHVASLALLRRIRELDPTVITMIGGANCETAMGLATHRNFPWVDYVVSGEADGLIAELCKLVLEHGRDVPITELPRGVLGPRHRSALPLAGASRPAAPARALFRDLDRLPVPDFHDYFRELANTSLFGAIRPGMPFETSRGCWWGARHQCTFCGLNGSSMAFHSKSPELVLRDLSELEARHGASSFEAVDNIMDTGYFTSLLPALAEAQPRRQIFYEVKANLSRRQVESMARAGVVWVQPGIESLHTEVLRLMDKGVTGWQNVQLMKWAQQYGVRLSWSILWGFPGESDAWYAEMAEWMPLLEHLQPPSSLVRLRYDRFSVYHRDAKSLGLELRPVPSLRYVYPVPEEELADLTYFFTADPPSADPEYFSASRFRPADRPGLAAARAAGDRWREAANDPLLPPVLSMTDQDGALDVIDSRRCAESPRTRLSGLDRAVYLACDNGPRPGRVGAIVRGEYGLEATDEQVARSVDELCRRKLLLAMDGRVLSLAVMEPAPAMPDLAQFPGGQVDVLRETPHEVPTLAVATAGVA